MVTPLKNWNRLKRGYVFRQKTWYSKYHLGLDLIAPKGTPIYAPCDGFVKTMHGVQGGNTVWFYFNNYIMRVLHLLMFDQTGKVKEGNIIGYVGNTGILSRGYHAHIDISKNKVNIWDINNFINPELFFNINDMEYVIDKNNDQYLRDDSLKIAISIADEKDLGRLLERGLTGAPKRVNDMNKYLVYRGMFEEEWSDTLNLKLCAK